MAQERAADEGLKMSFLRSFYVVYGEDAIFSPPFETEREAAVWLRYVEDALAPEPTLRIERRDRYRVDQIKRSRHRRAIAEGKMHLAPLLERYSLN